MLKKNVLYIGVILAVTALSFCFGLMPGCGGGEGGMRNLIVGNLKPVSGPGNGNEETPHVVYSLVEGDVLNKVTELHAITITGQNDTLLLRSTDTLTFDSNSESSLIVYSLGAMINNSDIYEIRSDGTGNIRFASSTTNEIFPKLSADNSKIFFTRSVPMQDDTYHFNIMSVSTTGTQEKQYLDSTVRTSIGPFEVAPGESFAIYPNTFINPKKLYKYDAASKQETLIFSNGNEISTRFHISPDSEKILLYTDCQSSGACYKIHIMDPSGEDILVLSKIYLPYAAWSTDSERFAYTDYTSQDGFMINVTDMNSNTTTILKSGSNLVHAILNWSKDGTRILAGKLDTTDPTLADLVYFKPDGTGETRIIHFSNPDKGLGTARFVK